METYTEFKPLATKLASEKLQAEFIPIKYRDPDNLYGYYYIKDSSLGPVIAEFNTFIDDDGGSYGIHIKVRDSGNCAYCCEARDKKCDWKIGKKFIKSLHAVPSKLSWSEGVMLCLHFLDSPEQRIAVNNHYLNTRVMYDTMASMMRPGCNRKVYDVNGGHIICGTFDNKEVEIIKLKKHAKRNKYDELEEIVQITIPSVGLMDNFECRKSGQDNLVYNIAQKMLHLPEQRLSTDITSADFSRWDTAYHDMMAKIASKREKAK